jgi:hypothetical protein
VPGFAFSTANAFVLRGGVPVFVDIRPDKLNIDETRIDEAITPRTKAIVPVHDAGVSCEMDAIMAIAERHSRAVVEDAAQGVMASYCGRLLGDIGELGTLSFHETTNVILGDPSRFAGRPSLRPRQWRSDRHQRLVFPADPSADVGRTSGSGSEPHRRRLNPHPDVPRADEAVK